ncbi:MAG: hypothetical protein RLZZ600_294 [Actinomycetota bacterium]
MSTVATHISRHRGEMIALWVLLAVSFASALVPLGAAGAFGLILGWIPVVFAFWHFIRWAGAQTALLSFIAVAVVSFIGEALGVATGLVFGNYYYPDGPLGPLLLGVPPLIQLQYFAMAYAALMLARAVSGSLTSALRGWRMLWVAALAAFAQTLLDLASDPWHSTVLEQWIWRDGGAYFGVPMQNFFGWFFETLVFFIILQLLLARRTAVTHIEAPKPRDFYAQGVLLYGTFPVAIVLIPVVNQLSGEESTIAVAMATVAVFAVAPLWLAALLAKRR